MSATLFLAPATAGKTAYVVELARQHAGAGIDMPRVVVARPLQVFAWQKRLALAGGALGVHVLTFDRLYADSLAAARETYVQLPDPVQFRLLRAVVDAASLEYYAPIVGKPGFIQALQKLIAELKAARVWPETLAAAVTSMGGEARLLELARVYADYQQQLQARNWADRAGIGWLAVEALTQRAVHLASDWPLLVVDGFDNFTEVQLAFLAILAQRAKQTVITLTGNEPADHRPVFRRFETTRARIESALGESLVRVEPLPQRRPVTSPTLAHVETSLYGINRQRVANDGALALIACPDRATEVREALRWLKARLVFDELSVDEIALLARSLTPYRAFITQIAAEFGLPVRMVSGHPLRSNPAVAAILDLLRLALPVDDSGGMALPRRQVVDNWRCPYFNLHDFEDPSSGRRLGITPIDADTLDRVARAGQVMRGLDQWNEGFRAWATRAAAAAGDEPGADDAVPPVAADPLQNKFYRFVQLITPPAGATTYRDFVAWLESIIGPDPLQENPDNPQSAPVTSLQMLQKIRDARRAGDAEGLVERDMAALQRLKEVLRGLVWAEEVIPLDGPLIYQHFFNELKGVIDATTYHLPLAATTHSILVADVTQARGLPLKAVAVLGLAEGEFPAALREDILLKDADREQLRRDFHLPVDLSTDSAETEFFYETVTRPSHCLLLTRPRLADTGAEWPPSPFWEEVTDLVDVKSVSLSTENLPSLEMAASWPELLEVVAAHSASNTISNWIQTAQPCRWSALARARQILAARARLHQPSVFDGDMTTLTPLLAQHFGTGQWWSATQFEAFYTCPLLFCFRQVLQLAPREEPAEGLDAAQLGSIYHRILSRLFAATAGSSDLQPLLAALPSAAAGVLDTAPEQDGFRRTAWWEHTRVEIEATISRSLPNLCRETSGYTPIRLEAWFSSQHPLVIRREDDSVRVRGIIDRVDRNEHGKLLVIDYKTAGHSSYTFPEMFEGRRLQLPLYAMAAQEALQLGETVDGFFWHIGDAQSSSLRLAKHAEGVPGCIQVAVELVWQAVDAVRSGQFQPRPPDNGCPRYCPAAGVCWHYRPGFGG